MFMGLSRGEGALAIVVFVLVYAGVVLPRLGERLGVFLASWRMQSRAAKASAPPHDQNPRE